MVIRIAKYINSKIYENISKSYNIDQDIRKSQKLKYAKKLPSCVIEALILSIHQKAPYLFTIGMHNLEQILILIFQNLKYNFPLKQTETKYGIKYYEKLIKYPLIPTVNMAARVFHWKEIHDEIDRFLLNPMDFMKTLDLLNKETLDVSEIIAEN